MLAKVSKRTPFTLPRFNKDKFASVIPTALASSLELTLRIAIMTSKLTIMSKVTQTLGFLPQDRGQL